MKELINIISFSENIVLNSKKFLKNVAMIYKISGGNLLKSQVNFHFEGQMMGIFEENIATSLNIKEVIDDIFTEFKTQKFKAIYLDFKSEKFVELVFKLDERAFSYGVKLFVPHIFANTVKYANIVVDTGISGGNLKSILKNFKDFYGEDRFSVKISHNVRKFYIPSGNREEEILENVFLEDVEGFFSDNLCTNYFTKMIENDICEFVIYDDFRSFKEKLKLLDELGVKNIFLNFSDFLKYNI